MSKLPNNQPQNRQVRIEIKDDIADGTYANISFIASNNSEFIFDFARFLPGNSRGKVVSRVVMGPIHAKAFLKSLNEAVERFEKQHGIITAENLNKNIGFAIDQDILKDIN
ncbi:MAG: DUF3467 domain-containing protein [Candidatus Latescibacteria bacterium]|nr:DUF3467 domain-containing protein [Candidatus Latescibacterota bacterium]